MCACRDGERQAAGSGVGAAKMPWDKLRVRLRTNGWACCHCSRRGREPREKRRKATPLPWTKLLVVCAVLFANNFGINMIFPFLPFLIHDFFPYLDKTELGNKAGYLGSAYFVGSFIGSLLWGWISDKIGRRPVLLMGMLGTLATELLFGFSQNFAWAIAARFLWGLLNGNLGVAKTYISEVCDDSNQARGFSLVGTTGGFGRLSGSVIGGYLAQPASKFGPLQHPFFCKYPYSLPCIVGGGLAVISFVASFFFLEESLHTKRRNRRFNGEEGSVIDTSLSEERNDSSSSMQSNDSGIELVTSERRKSDTELLDLSNGDIDDIDEYTTSPDGLLMAESDVDTDSDFERVDSGTELLIAERQEEAKNLRRSQGRLQNCLIKFREVCIPECIFTQCTPTHCYHSARHSVVDSYENTVACLECLKVSCSCWGQRWTPGEAGSGGRVKLRKAGRSFIDVLRLMLDRRVFLSTLLYGLLSFVSIISNELVPLLLVTDHESGGYNMDDSEIGVVLMCAAVFQLFWQLFVFPRIANLIGYRRTMMSGLFVFGVICLLFPFSNRITGPIGDDIDLWGSGLNSTDGDVKMDYCGNKLSGENADNLVNENSVDRIPVRVWFWLIFVLAFWITSRVMAFTSVMVLISNSSLPETRGTVNGYGQALCAFGRSLGPVMGAPLFAWSENTGKGWPLNYHLVFDLLAIGGIVLILVTLLLPKSIELKRVRPVSNESAQLVFETENSESDQERTTGTQHPQVA